MRGCRGATLPAFARWPHTRDSANKQRPLVPNAPSEHCALPSRKRPTAQQKNLAAPRGDAGERRSPPSRDSRAPPIPQTSNIQLVKSEPTCSTLNRNVQPRSERISLPLEGMQGHDAPRPRAMATHLRFCKQAAPRSSQTLHRNTALYLQENVQPRSKRTSPSLVGMQGSDAPRPRATVTHLRFCKQATSSSSKANQHALPSIETFNRAAKESRCLLRGCRGATLPALARRSRTSDSANKQRPARPKRSIGTLCATLNRNAQPRSKRTSPPLEGMQGSDAPRSRTTATHLQFANKQHPARHKQTNTLYPQ